MSPPQARVNDSVSRSNSVPSIVNTSSVSNGQSHSHVTPPSLPLPAHFWKMSYESSLRANSAASNDLSESYSLSPSSHTDRDDGFSPRSPSTQTMSPLPGYGSNNLPALGSNFSSNSLQKTPSLPPVQPPPLALSSPLPQFDRFNAIDPGPDAWDDRCIDRYYQVIHTTLSILPSSKVRLRTRLNACTNHSIRIALLHSINAITSASDPKYLTYAKHSYNQASRLLTGVLLGPSVSPAGILEDLDYQTRILVLMTYILLYLGSEVTTWLSSAISLAYQMDLHRLDPLVTNDVQTDSFNHPQSLEFEDDKSISRRLFLILVVLDTMNACVNFQPLQIPTKVVHLNKRTDSLCFGNNGSGIEIVCISLILGKACTYWVYGEKNEDRLNNIFKELGDMYSGVESLWDTNPILKTLYYMVVVYLDLLMVQNEHQQQQQQMGSTKPFVTVTRLLTNITVLLQLMDSPVISMTPLLGQFMKICTETLCQLTKYTQIDTTDVQRQLSTLKDLAEKYAGPEIPWRYQVLKRIQSTLIKDEKLHVQQPSSLQHHLHQPMQPIHLVNSQYSLGVKPFAGNGLDKLAIAAKGSLGI